MTTTAADTKTCRRCNETKPLADYYRQSASPGGYMAVCKDCQKIRQRGGRVKMPEENRPQQIPEWREMLRVCIRTGEIKTDRRRERCTWLNDQPGNRRKSYESGD